MSTADFEALRAGAAAAKMARDEAEALYRVAVDALIAAECKVHYDTTPSDRPGYMLKHHCTLQKGHDGEHGKARA